MPITTAVRHSLAAIKANSHLNAFTAVHPEAQLLAAAEAARDRISEGKQKFPLNGRLIGIKDNIATVDSLPTSCASEMLRDYKSPFEATVVAKLRQAGAIVVGKTNMDEFGMGSHSTFSIYGAVKNPADPETSAGGSSGGSAAAVAAGMCDAALGTDTGGSVRLPAAYCGVVGFKPSYGLVSRWGVVAYANSLDTVGILSRTVSSAREVFAAIAGPDTNDPTSISASTRARVLSRLAAGRRGGKEPLRIGLPLEYNLAELSPAVRAAWLRVLTQLSQNHSHQIVPVSLPSTRHALSAYYVLAPAEASSNLARYDGLRYGSRAATDRSGDSEQTLFAPTRGAKFGDEVKRRILLGAYSLSAGKMDNYFLLAQRIRRLVCNDFDRVFAAPNWLRSALVDPTKEEEEVVVDVILAPTALGTAPKLGEEGGGVVGGTEGVGGVGGFVNDVLTVPASLAGVPAVSVPVSVSVSGAAVDEGGEEAVRVGVQVIAQWGDEKSLWRVAEEVEGIGG